jgi:dTDP-4-amino-4,6-dideoxygalactose transaminase
MLRLNVPNLTGLLLHQPNQLLGSKGKVIWKTLQKLKEDGVIEKVGFSVYNPNELDLLWPFFQAALGVSQIQRLDEFVAKRHTLMERYNSLLNDNLPVIKPYQGQDSYSALHLYPIQIDLDNIGKSRQKIFDELRKNNIGVNVHYIPIHTQLYYQQLGFQEGDFPNSEAYYNRSISIPLSHVMTLEQQDKVCVVLKRVLQ